MDATLWTSYSIIILILFILILYFFFNELQLFVGECYVAFGSHLKVPVVGMVTSKLFDWMSHPMGNPHSLSFVPSIFSGKGQHMNFIERLENTLLSSAITAQYKYYITSQLNYVEDYFGIKISSMSELYKDIAVMLVNSHPSYDFIRPMTPRIIEVGGLHVTDGHQDFTPVIIYLTI